MAAIYSNGGNRWNILACNFTKRYALSSVYKISMVSTGDCQGRALAKPLSLGGGGGGGGGVRFQVT
jgi:hypothetical protein